MDKLFIYPTPLSALCQIQSDSGWSGDLTPDTDSNGRQGKSVLVPDAIPNGWGSRLVISAPGKMSFMNRGFLVHVDNVWRFQLDDVTLNDSCPEPIPVPPNPNPTPDPMPSDPAGIINWTYKQKHYDLSTKTGCGQFTEDCCTNLHNGHSIQWGHIRKTGAQNQYNGHAVDAVMLLNTRNGTEQGIYDIIISSESNSAKPAFNRQGDANPSLWYYPA